MQKISQNEFLSLVKYTSDGLAPVIVQQFDTKEVLMMAWVNEQALQETLDTQKMCYYSRSRQQLWRKGETSGHTQALKEMRIDCDADTLLALVDQVGAACHTNKRTCFYRGL